jgi:hypothetical protein
MLKGICGTCCSRYRSVVAWVRELPAAVATRGQIRRRQRELGLLLAGRLHGKTQSPQCPLIP